jgi:hypothetical protein
VEQTDGFVSQYARYRCCVFSDLSTIHVGFWTCYANRERQFLKDLCPREENLIGIEECVQVAFFVVEFAEGFKVAYIIFVMFSIWWAYFCTFSRN